MQVPTATLINALDAIHTSGYTGLVVDTPKKFAKVDTYRLHPTTLKKRLV
jgi:hypothetical protein